MALDASSRAGLPRLQEHAAAALRAVAERAGCASSVRVADEALSAVARRRDALSAEIDAGLAHAPRGSRRPRRRREVGAPTPARRRSELPLQRPLAVTARRPPTAP